MLSFFLPPLLHSYALFPSPPATGSLFFLYMLDCIRNCRNLLVFRHFGVFGYENHTQVSNGRPGRLVCFALKTGTHSARHTHACLHTAPHTLGHLRNPSLQPPTGRRSTCSVQDLRLWSSSPFASNRHPASPTTALQVHVVPRPTATLRLHSCTGRPSKVLEMHAVCPRLLPGPLGGCNLRQRYGGAGGSSDLEALDVHLLPRPTATLRHHSCTGRPL